MGSISIVIPAFNEEANILKSFRVAQKVVSQVYKNYEIIIIDDCSVDNTFRILKKIKINNHHCKIFRNKKNYGLGKTLLKGYNLATKKYVIYFTGDDQIIQSSFKSMILLGKKNLNTCIVSYHSNMKLSRPYEKYLISKIYNFIVTRVFFIKLNYTTGPALYKTSELKKIKCFSVDRFVPTEILFKYIKKNKKFINFDLKIKKRKHGSSQIVTFKALKDVSINFVKLFYFYFFK